jgi:hypothetical protein
MGMPKHAATTKKEIKAVKHLRKLILENVLIGDGPILKKLRKIYNSKIPEVVAAPN